MVRAIHPILMLACLAACSAAPTDAPQELSLPPAPAPARVSKPTVSTPHDSIEASDEVYDPGLPADACTAEGYWSFFETFVYSPTVRTTHTLAPAVEAAEDFAIALVDNQWMLKDGASGSYLPIEIVQQRDGNAFTVTYRMLDGAGRRIKPATYRFVFTEGCWRLAERSGP